MDKSQVSKLVTGEILLHKTSKNADGTPMRWKVNGAVKLWKTRPDDFKVPIKNGLYNYCYLIPDNVGDFYLDK